MAAPSNLSAVTANTGQMIYNNPHWGASGGSLQYKDSSTIGQQIRLDVFIRQALEELAKERFFTQMSGVYNLPKHSGKTIKKFKYLPLLDDRNKNNQGIDATGQKLAGSGEGTYGNLYGSSKNVVTIQGKLPTLTEYGGRVNRVGFTRTILEGSVRRLGFFYEFTKESLDFDNDATLLQHMGKEALRGAYEIQEDMIAIELLKGAGVTMYAGGATAHQQLTAEDPRTAHVVTYKDLQKLALTLKENRAPNQLKASTGSQIIDSHIIGSGYALYVGYPLENQLRNMTDAHLNPVFIPVEKYAAAGTKTLHGEIGTIGQFRIVVVPEMPEYQAAGAQDMSNDNTTHRKSKGYAGAPDGHTSSSNWYYDVFPMMAVASEAFTCLGFQADMGGKGNFKLITRMPGTETADRTDPYGQSGFTSIQWTHGMLIEHPEWIATFYTLAEV